MGIEKKTISEGDGFCCLLISYLLQFLTSISFAVYMSATAGAALALVLSAAEAFAADEWWDQAWQARRKVMVAKGQQWDGSEIAHVAFPACTQIQKDGIDVRVVTPAGIEVDSKVLFADLGRVCHVLFRLQKVERTYYVYYGNPDAKPLDKRLDVDRGLILTTGPRLRVNCASWQDMKTIMESSGGIHGCAPVPNVFLGHNPFGPSTFFWTSFKGFINAPASGVYVFSTASSDSSFLFIDGKEVVSWPGRHGAQEGQYGERNGSIELEAGMHRIEYYHEFTRGRPAAVLGWIPPGGKNPTLVPSDAFPGFQKGTAQPVELRGTPAGAADFIFEPLGACEGFGARFYAVRFRNPPGMKQGAFKWDFGDGMSCAEENPVHVYLHEGKYIARLAVSEGPGAGTTACMTVDTEIEVFPARWESIGQMYPVLMKYDLKEVQTPDLAVLLEVSDSVGTKPDQISVLRLLLERGEGEAYADPLAKSRICKIALRLGVILAQDTDDHESALAAFKKAAGHAPDAKLAGAASLGAAWAGYLVSKDGPKAQSELAAIINGLGEKEADLRRAGFVLSGDVHLDAGDLKGAVEAYGRADAMKAKKLSAEEELVKKGDYSIRVQNHLYKEEFYKGLEEVRKWEEEFPLEKIEGYSTSLRLRCLFGLKRFKDVARDGLRFIGLNVRNHFSPGVMYLTGQGLWAEGEMQKALDTFDSLVSSFPESPEKQKAERMAEKIRTLLAKKSK